jgi:hypothetical protein
MPNTLGLDDDLDPVEAVVRLEKAFAVKIRDDEAASCSTVGDIYDLLHARVATKLGGPGACMTSMAFYRLRRSLRGTHPGVEFRPTTPLTKYAGPNARRFLNRLGRDTGLQLPGPQRGWLSGLGFHLILIAVVSSVAVAVTKGPTISYFGGIALFAAGIASIKLDPCALSGDCTTLGELATKASALNYGSLAGAGGAVRPNDLWDAMTEVLSGLSELPRSGISRDTLILHRQTP